MLYIYNMKTLRKSPKAKPPVIEIEKW